MLIMLFFYFKVYCCYILCIALIVFYVPAVAFVTSHVCEKCYINLACLCVAVRINSTQSNDNAQDKIMFNILFS